MSLHRPLASPLLGALPVLLALLTTAGCLTDPAEKDTPDKDQAAANEPGRPPAPSPIVSADQLGMPAAHMVGNVILAGQPKPVDFGNLRDAGGTLVINVREPSEMSFDEAALVQGLGMRYVSLGFTPASLDDQVVEAFIVEIKARKPEDGKLLVHCSSGNRVAALWAMYEIKELKVDPQMAVERARKLGLTSAEMVGYIGDYSRRIGAF